MKIVPVLLAGGIGERFWPLSRSTRPKQLLQLISRKTMIEETVDRIKPLCRSGSRPVMVTGAKIASLIRKGLPAKTELDWIVEPQGKNTAPAVAAAAAWVVRKYGDAVMAVLSADHAISPANAFRQAIRQAASLAEAENCLVVFGIKPSRPDTGYGYIHLGAKMASGSLPSYRVNKFVEKPDQRTAVTYCKSGKYLWNSGMFVWKASVILEEFKTSMPDIYAEAVKLSESGFTAKAVERFYANCVKESIDYGIMEKARSVAAIAADFSWDDIGSWESVSRINPVNDRGTVVSGPAIFEQDCRETIVVNRSKTLIAACGLTDLVVVGTEDAVLVIPRAELPNVKKYLSAMKADKRIPKNLF
jgi:mannose-1-phosphate guanylyltransferase